ncbi:MAG: ATPase [Paludibacteraceae bacterium]|nr:ATPase [Paludibacteraceae bacterium]
MKIIADSGSTKTKFAVVSDNGDVNFVLTDGINPYYQSGDDIQKCLSTQLLPNIKIPEKVTSVEFYGAGCSVTDKIETVKYAIKSIFPFASVTVGSDMIGAAKALCGKDKGIACIMGTGSNSCFWDGTKIIQNVPALGFIIGDEGSGGVLGKLLVADILKNQAPKDIQELFYSKYNMDAAYIVDRIYKQPFPNRFLASFAPFLSENINNQYCYNLVYNSFCSFINRNLKQYPSGYKANFTGSVAYYFRNILAKAIADCGMELGIIEREPMQRLLF